MVNSSAFPGWLAARIAPACARGGVGLFHVVEALAQDGLREPVQLQPALVEPAKRTADNPAQHLPRCQRVSHAGGKYVRQRTGSVREPDERDRLGCQESAQRYQLRRCQVLRGEPLGGQLCRGRE